MVAQGAFVACKIGDIETVKSFSNVESFVDGDGASCLHYAARGGSVAVVEYLVKSRGLSVLSRSRTGATALHDAAARGNTAVVKWLVEDGGVDVDVVDGFGVTALHLAARYGHILTVEWLLDEAGADASKRSNEGALPLHFAVVGGDMNCVKILVDENPRLVNMQTNNGAAPIYLASQAGRLDIVEYLISRKAATKVKAYDMMSCLHAAAQMGHLDVVKWLVTVDKSNPNERDFDGNTPLHFAAGRGHADIVRWLLKEGGARVTLDNLGGSPLHSAAEMGELQCVQALLDCGCDVDLTDNAGLTAAELADKCGQFQAAALILGQGSLSDLGIINSGVLEKHQPSSPLPNTLPPAVPPKGFHIATHSTNPSASHSPLVTSPPLPRPPAHPLSVASTPSTADSPITPPPPLHEEWKDSWRKSLVGVGKPLIERTVSEVSVDSSASNFGVFDQRDAGIVHTVTAEIHTTPTFIPPTPKPVSFPVVPGHGSLNSTQESIIYSTSSSSFSNEESSPIPGRKFVGQKTSRFFEDFHGKGLLEVYQHNHHHHHHLPPSPPVAYSTLAHRKDTAEHGIPTNVTSVHDKSFNNNDNDDSTLPVTSVRDAVKKINKFQYYSTPYKQDFNTVTKSSFAKAKALFQYSQANDVHICPDNGEICSNSEKEYYSIKQAPTSNKMDPSRHLQAESNNGQPGYRSFAGSNVPHSSETQSSMKSVITIQGSHAKIVSTGQEKTGNKVEESLVSLPSKQKDVHPLSGLGAQKTQLRTELDPCSSSQMNDISSSPLVNGHVKATAVASELVAGGSGATRPASVPHHLAVNGAVLKENDRPTSSKQHSRSSSSSSTSSQTFSPIESKHNLIADIQSAVSGTSNLSLRRTKGKGEGVSMVYQSKKGGGGHGEVKVDSSPLTGQFDPKNFLDKVETVDASGRAIPEWRRQVLAKHLAEKAQKEFEEKKSVEDYEARFKDMPAWKRALIERKEAQTRDLTTPIKK